MFTGIIAARGVVRRAHRAVGQADARLVIETPPGFLDGAVEGASIACSGVCLTALAIGPTEFAVDVSDETVSRTAIGAWRPGLALNLERSLRVGDELGGHLVSGHVDGLGRVVSVDPVEGSRRLRVRLPAPLAPFVAAKGSVALDGVSLTVNTVEDDDAGAVIGVNIVPHTGTATTLGERVPGDGLHVEIDMLARYVARLAAALPR